MLFPSLPGCVCPIPRYKVKVADFGTTRMLQELQAPDQQAAASGEVLALVSGQDCTEPPLFSNPTPPPLRLTSYTLFTCQSNISFRPRAGVQAPQDAARDAWSQSAAANVGCGCPCLPLQACLDSFLTVS